MIFLIKLQKILFRIQQPPAQEQQPQQEQEQQEQQPQQEQEQPPQLHWDQDFEVREITGHRTAPEGELEVRIDWGPTWHKASELEVINRSPIEIALIIF